MIGSWLDYAGVATFAASSASQLRRRGLDLTATWLLASIAAIGGGTVRDVIIRHPVFWVVNPAYVLSCLAAATLVWIVGLGPRGDRIVTLLEAIGLGSFAVSGAAEALHSGLGAVVATIMGVLTATFGGIVGDALGGRRTVLTRKDIYVSAALVSAVSYCGLRRMGAPEVPAGLIGAFLGSALRIAAFWFGWRMPGPHRAR